MDYITREDKERLQAQLKECIAKRKVITERIGTAREMGDLRENAEYHAAREDQGMNEVRITELEHRLNTAIVTDAQELPEGMVFLGATVKIRDVDSGAEEMYRLVGDLSDSPEDDVIEVTPTSPLGEALIKSRVGEVVRVSLRRGSKRLEIVDIV